MACVDELLQNRTGDIRERIDAMLLGRHLLDGSDTKAFRLAPELTNGTNTIAERVLKLANARVASRIEAA
jgi:hypothetical protein